MPASNLKTWKVNSTEMAQNLEEMPPYYIGRTSTTTWKLHIPKIMPLIDVGHPKCTVGTVDTTMFINEKSCKPVVASTVKIQNFITVPRPACYGFAHPYKRHKMELELEVLHDNMDNMRITNTVDNSIEWPYY